MAQDETIRKVKTDLRISHSKLDEAIGDDIDACLSDLIICGIVDPDETDPMILAAIKNHARSNFIDKPDRAAEYAKRYDAQKSCLMMASGYGGAHGRE